jgi:hypothetical protein
MRRAPVGKANVVRRRPAHAEDQASIWPARDDASPEHGFAYIAAPFGLASIATARSTNRRAAGPTWKPLIDCVMPRVTIPCVRYDRERAPRNLLSSAELSVRCTRWARGATGNNPRRIGEFNHAVVPIGIRGSNENNGAMTSTHPALPAANPNFSERSQLSITTVANCWEVRLC